MTRDAEALREMADKIEAVLEMKETVSGSVDNAEGVDFPGMFG